MPRSPRPPVVGKARLVLIIEVVRKKGTLETPYLCQFLPSDPSIGKPAWRLTKPDKTTYEVVMTEHGPVCNCADFTFCRGNIEKGCKHTASLKAVGLLR